MKLLLCALALALPLAAQRDFLTPDEIAQIREAQEPNLRLQLYSKFAKDRVDMLKDLMARNQSGRSLTVRETLDAYTKILDAIDDVADDALSRKLDISKGLTAVADAEKAMLPELKKVQAMEAKDAELYSFALRQAIDTTQDSLDLSQEDLGKRTKEVQARDAKEKQTRETMMSPEEVESRKAQEKKADAEKKKKGPTLRRPGEVPKDQ